MIPNTKKKKRKNIKTESILSSSFTLRNNCNYNRTLSLKEYIESNIAKKNHERKNCRGNRYARLTMGVTARKKRFIKYAETGTPNSGIRCPIKRIRSIVFEWQSLGRKERRKKKLPAGEATVSTTEKRMLGRDSLAP